MNPINSATHAGLLLEEVLSSASGLGDQGLRFSSCTNDWQNCRTGDLFVAIDTGFDDGHDHAHEAVQRGAIGIVTERLLAVDVPQCLVEDSREAFGLLCHALTGNPSRQLLSVAVSGSDGRTVTCHLLESILEAAGVQVGLASTLNGGLKKLASVETVAQLDCDREVLADPAMTCSGRLAEWMSEQVLRGRTATILETGTVALARRGLAGTGFDAAVITNIRSDDAELPHGEASCLRLHQRIVDHLKPGGIAVVNADDPHSIRLLPRLTCPVLTFGIRQPADVRAELIDSDRSGQTFCLHAGNDSAMVRTPTIGFNFVQNALAAAAVALSQNIELPVIARGIEQAGLLAGRMERIECGQEFGVWIDAAWRPATIGAALHSLRQVTSGRILVAATLRPEQTPAQRKRIGELLQRHCSQVVITQPDCALMRDYEPAHQMLDGVGEHDQVRLIPNRMDAIEWLLGEARPGDAVLLTGVGELPIATIGEEAWSIGDRELVQAWLYDLQERISLRNSKRAQIYRLEDYRQ